MVPFLLFKHR